MHVIDSLRPFNLESLFMGDERGEKIVIWDDGGVEKLQEEMKSYEALTVCVFSEPTYSCPLTVRGIV